MRFISVWFENRETGGKPTGDASKSGISGCGRSMNSESPSQQWRKPVDRRGPVTPDRVESDFGRTLRRFSSHKLPIPRSSKLAGWTGLSRRSRRRRPLQMPHVLDPQAMRARQRRDASARTTTVGAVPFRSTRSPPISSRCRGSIHATPRILDCVAPSQSTSQLGTQSKPNTRRIPLNFEKIGRLRPCRALFLPSLYSSPTGDRQLPLQEINHIARYRICRQPGKQSTGESWTDSFDGVQNWSRAAWPRRINENSLQVSQASFGVVLTFRSRWRSLLSDHGEPRDSHPLARACIPCSGSVCQTRGSSTWKTAHQQRRECPRFGTVRESWNSNAERWDANRGVFGNRPTAERQGFRLDASLWRYRSFASGSPHARSWSTKKPAMCPPTVEKISE